MKKLSTFLQFLLLQQIRIMGKITPELKLISFILISFKISLLDCRSIDLVFTGEGCECPNNLPFEVSVPVPAPALPSIPLQLPYKIEIPVEKAKFSYSLDFQVEAPSPPIVPPVPAPRNLVARVDRISMPRPDCPGTNPPKCTCNSISHFDECPFHSVTDLAWHSTKTPVNYLRVRRSTESKPKTSKKKYAKIQEKRLNLKNKLTNYRKDAAQKRTYKKSLITKREISDEFDSMGDKEMHSINLQNPDVIQYMPEVLSPNFEKGKCFNCFNDKSNRYSLEDRKIKNQKSEMLPKKRSYFPSSSASLKQLPSSFANHNYPHFSSYQPYGTPVNMYPQYTRNFHQNPIKNFYQSQHQEPVLHYRNEKQMQLNRNEEFLSKSLSSSSDINNADSLKFFYPVNSDGKFHEATMQKSLDENTVEVPPSINIPRKPEYRDDIEMEQLIRDIINSHPDFIEASDHGEGILTPSVEAQRHDARSFIRRLIGDRLAKMAERRHNRRLNIADSGRFDPARMYMKRSFEEKTSVKENLQKNSNTSNPNSIEGKNHETKIVDSVEKRKSEANIIKFHKDGKILQILSSQPIDNKSPPTN